MARSAECSAPRQRFRRKNRNLSLCRTYIEAKKHVSEYPTWRRSDRYRCALVMEEVLRRSSIEPGLGGCCCFPCWVAPESAALVGVLVQVPCEGRAPLVAASARMTVFAHVPAWLGSTASICCTPRGIVCGRGMVDGWRQG